MNKLYTFIFVIALVCTNKVVLSQNQIQDSIPYPYKLPILGDKAFERGYKLQKPLGFSVYYVNSSLDLEISDFTLWLGDDRNSNSNQLLATYLNEETLNFTKATATVNGFSTRADAWILPFLNVYGLFSWVTGGTQVELQPTWYDNTGDTVVLQLPKFGSDVEFDAIGYGIGGTAVYGVNNWFASLDGNYSWTRTELLNRDVAIATASIRVGKQFEFKNKQRLAVYTGTMYRDFLADGPNEGKIKLNDALPEAEDRITKGLDDAISENQSIINEIEQIPRDDRTAVQKKQLYEARRNNLILVPIDNYFTENGDAIFNTLINYQIQKDLPQPWTFQFGFNYELNTNWMLRGEFGFSGDQRLILTGIQYRFGLGNQKWLAN